MKTLNVTILENEYSKLGLNSSDLTFDELFKKISILIAKESLAKCRQIAKKTGLSKMTQEEIDKEISE
ncbi:MAG: hypothetical protein A2033_10145 [Bacteroidetes bacterium GWA2_31_9]|nr:MAG: hypothetical protein A2033_10145 [Bacteroidetes bacterium GWA2_31_9]